MSLPQAGNMAKTKTNLIVVTDQPLGNATWFIGTFTLDGYIPRRLHAAFDLVQSGKCKPSANARACGNRRDKPDAIQAVVDSHAHAANGYCQSRECA